MMPILIPAVRKKGLNVQYAGNLLTLSRTSPMSCGVVTRFASTVCWGLNQRRRSSPPNRNGDRVKSPSGICRDHQQDWYIRCTSVMGSNTSVMNSRRVHGLGSPGSSTSSHNYTSGTPASQRVHSSLHKSLDLFIRVTSKFPLVIVLLLLVMFAIPSCAAVLALYLLITILFGLPSFLVLYFAYPALEWLIKEITA
ncbi:hypothetical protein T459_02204 [Capsicum annuum]|uniref:Uncharacterized protein n=1 Tax=Capsicum annuum TaxID=4072 RepID=A0A2G3AJC1_CAPAN|nr:hypothetical protein T459_02204 [Capsicum annuum]